MASLLEKTHCELDGKTEKPEKRTGSKLRLSYALLAFAVIGLTDLAARALYHPDPYQSPNRSWAWWAVQDLRAQKSADIVIFGSSLMLAALNDGDSTYLNRPFDAVTHHRALYLERLLKERLNKPVSTASLAIGGQMASDVYALTTTLFTRNPVPSNIVWGIAPRDFLDSSFTNPDSSETVRYMNKVSESTDVLSTNRRILWDRIQNIADGGFYLYGKRGDIIATTLPYAKSAIKQVRPDIDPETVHTPSPLLSYAMKNLPEDNGVDQWRVTPYSPSKVFADNTAEYMMRYHPFKPKVLETQLAYFEKFLSFADKHGISVTLVNMPLTEDNLKLLPPGAYQAYLTGVKGLATKHGAQFLDFNDQKTFPRLEFADTVHLNGIGGKHFFELVSQQMRSRPQ
ncbi:MAG: hypothetical protein EKK48_16915 [Candidatus Melainabacteria bacterium]|nr:MAG: hypothetical protein EKK48_16915 [Candidatus Melainabacteria bacterium]